MLKVMPHFRYSWISNVLQRICIRLYPFLLYCRQISKPRKFPGINFSFVGHTELLSFICCGILGIYAFPVISFLKTLDKKL